MSEPTLEDIEDYDTLKGEKKKVIWTLVIVSLIIGVIYVIVFNFDEKEEPISIDKTFREVPMR